MQSGMQTEVEGLAKGRRIVKGQRGSGRAEEVAKRSGVWGEADVFAIGRVFRKAQRCSQSAVGFAKRRVFRKAQRSLANGSVFRKRQCVSQTAELFGKRQIVSQTAEVFGKG